MASLSGIFPFKVMVEILACLPARSLVRFRCVSKSWRSLLSEPCFVKKWLNCSGTSLLVVPLEWENRDKCSLVFENVSIGKENLRLPLGNRWFSLSVVGSSGDGDLICLTGLSYISHRESKQTVILWRPFTGEVKALDNEGYIYCHHRPLCSESLIQGYNSGCCSHYNVHGFGYEPNAQDYKVVRITYSGGVARRAISPLRPWHIEVYSLGRDAWTSLSMPDFTWTIRGNSRAFVNGSAHWLTAPTEDTPYNSIAAFGMEKESFGEVIELPQLENLSEFSLNPRGKATLSVSCGWLALIAFSVWNQEECGIWVMKEYEVADSWTKQHHIVVPIGSTVRAVLGLTWRGKMLFRMVDEKLVCCDVEDMQTSEVGIQGGGPESSFDVIDLGGADPTLRNQVGRGEVKALGNKGCVHCHRRPVCNESLIQGYNSACCNQYLVHGFGYELNARDYKVVRITYSRGVVREDDSPIRPWLVEVYSLRRNAWKSLGRPSFTWTVRGNSRAFVNGSAHWLAAPTADAPYNSIVAFDMKEEAFGEVIELPRLENLLQFSLNPRGKATLSVSHGSLALIAFGIWNREECGIWVMKEYGVAESWTKQHHIVLPIGSTVRAALGLTGRGKMLLRMVDEKLMCCDVEDMQISEVGIQGRGTESSFDVIDLGGGDPTLRNQAGLDSLWTILNHK
ncbi:hypothetical protein NL676_035326 [Syzygium grande]|nr:hypothetical protein NL676_035326 [Syzygium grande]